MDDKRNYGGWIQTYSGGVFNGLDPNYAEVDIFDIAHALSLACRWTGHVRFHYSVAQHSVLVSEIVPRHDALWGLLHDASEAYIADMARPIKVGMPQYYEIEKRIMDAIADRFHLPRTIPKIVKWADDVLLCSEARDRLAPCIREWGFAATMPKERVKTIRWWPIWYAEYRFLKRYTELTGRRTFWRFVKNKLRDVASLFFGGKDPALEAAARAA